MSATEPGIRVECYAGYRGEETPRRFYLGERAIDVAEVLDRWLARTHRYFKVRGADGSIYILRHDVGSDRWALTLYRRDEDAPRASPNSSSKNIH